MTPRSSATAKCIGLAWLCGATIGPVGDHFHVATGVTEYFTDFGPIWLGNSPLWFVLLVATFMATIAVGQGRLANNGRGRAANRWIFGSPVVVLALYLTTSFYPSRDGGTLELVILAGAVATYLVLDRTWFGLVFGVMVAVGATAFEWGLVQLGVFRYLPQSDELFGVAPSLLPLYFAASVATGAVGRRMLSQ
ncbi:MAG: hypothetical protein K0V04_22320 [Deltaproteobacteria bacterium]|nr:hypothetical protein [Deltaproteobacteria bacterium]